MIGTPRSNGEGLRIFLLHHTHSDREWWTPFQASRIRLVEIIDELLEVLADRRGTTALTLLRAFGWVSREDLLARMGGAGPAQIVTVAVW